MARQFVLPDIDDGNGGSTPQLFVFGQEPVVSNAMHRASTINFAELGLGPEQLQVRDEFTNVDLQSLLPQTAGGNEMLHMTTKVCKFIYFNCEI